MDIRMPNPAKLMKIDDNPSQDRLLAAVRDLWEHSGAAGMSVRQISGLTGIPVSSIYHHFGSLEQLFLASQNSCIADMKAWCADQMHQLDGLDAAPRAFAGFFAQMVDAWCEERRDLAFAWRECGLLARQSALFQGPAREWDLTWEQFWREAGHRFDLGAGSLVAFRVFGNESFLHMIRWRRLADRAALDETARVLGAWLAGTAMPCAPWREFAREEAMRTMPDLPERDDVAARIVDAAARIIDEEGLARLTHRAVAERVGLTLGTVSHKFRTKSVLLEAAFEGLYRVNVERLHAGPSSSDSASDKARRGNFIDDLVGVILRGGSIRGGDELYLATARDPALRQFGAQLRYLRGRTSRGALQDLVGPRREVGITEAALFSGFVNSQLRAYGGSPPEATRHIRAEIETLLALAQAVPGGG